MNENQPSGESNLLHQAVEQLLDVPASDGPPLDVLDKVLKIPQTEEAAGATNDKVTPRADCQLPSTTRRAAWFVAAVIALVAAGFVGWIVLINQRDSKGVAVEALDKDQDKEQARGDDEQRSDDADDSYDDDRGNATSRSDATPVDKDDAASRANNGKYAYGDLGNESGRDGTKTLVVNVGDSALGNVSDEDAGAPLPFGREAWADDIGLGIVGVPFERDGSKFIPLDLIEVYKGRLPAGRFVAEDQEVLRVECTITERLGLRSELFKPKSHVGVFFGHDPKKGWTVTWIQGLSGSGERWRKTTKLFCDVQSAPEAKDPAARYEELLPLDEPLNGAACYGLQYKPSPHALPALRKHWQRVVMSEPDRAFSVASMLAMLQDAESVEPILDYACEQKFTGHQMHLFHALPQLCENADEEAIRKALRKLKDYFASLSDEELKVFEEMQRVSGYSKPMGALEELLNNRRSKTSQ